MDGWKRRQQKTIEVLVGTMILEKLGATHNYINKDTHRHQQGHTQTSKRTHTDIKKDTHRHQQGHTQTSKRTHTDIKKDTHRHQQGHTQTSKRTHTDIKKDTHGHTDTYLLVEELFHLHGLDDVSAELRMQVGLPMVQQRCR